MSGDDGEHITDTREMRKRLLTLALTGCLPGRRESNFCGPLIRNCMRAGEAAGLSGEDMYVTMVWQLLHQAMRLEKLVLDEAMSRPMRMIIEEPAGGQPPEPRMQG